jgi:MFS family permease
MSLSRYPSIIIAILALTGLAVVSQLYLPLPLIGSISGDYSVSAGAAGLLSTVFGVAYAIGFLFFGPLSDRLGRKVVMVGGLTALAAASVLVALVPSFGGVLAGRVVQGFVAAALPPVALAYLPEQLPDKLKVLGIAWMSTSFLLAGLLGQLYAGALGSLSAAVLPLAAIYAVAAALVVLLPEKPKGAAGDSKGAEGTNEPTGGLFSTYRGLGSLLSDGTLLRAYGGAFVLLFGFVGFYTALGLFGGEAISQAGLSLTIVRAVAVPAMFLALAASWFIGRYGPRTVVWSGFATAALGLFAAAGISYALGLSSALAVWLLVAASIVFVAGISVTVPSIIALVGSLAPEKRGTAVAFYTFVLFIGASLGPQLPAPLGNALGSGAGAGSSFALVCVVLGGVLMAAAALNARTPQTAAEPATSKG